MTIDVRRPIRIEPAFEDRERVRALFFEHGPYRSAAAYLPDGSDETAPRAADAVLPWFRETWALGGTARVEGAQSLLDNPRFVAAARALFGTPHVTPKTVVVNVNAPMPAGVPHVDVPTFRGASRENLPLRLLMAMGASGLFEPWRVLEAGAISWFYDGPGGTFDYWPAGLDGVMCSEGPPFGNVALMTDSDRMFHRIGAIGAPDRALPRMSAAAEIVPTTGGAWSIREGGEVRATYPANDIRLSVLWKAEVDVDGDGAARTDRLSEDRIMEILLGDLRARSRSFEVPSSITDAAFVSLAYATYALNRRPPAG